MLTGSRQLLLLALMIASVTIGWLWSRRFPFELMRDGPYVTALPLYRDSRSGRLECISVDELDIGCRQELIRQSVRWQVEAFPTSFPFVSVVEMNSSIEQFDSATFKSVTLMSPTPGVAGLDEDVLEVAKRQLQAKARIIARAGENVKPAEDRWLRRMATENAPRRVLVNPLLPCGLATATFGLMFVSGGIRQHRAERRRRAGCCVACGYAVGALEVCPECGREGVSLRESKATVQGSGLS